ncbi:hypothetical protein CSTERTH_03825 [Thermoclostridium stercorarium subsp. thermolacticum DSM 2910]|uniref:Uncharacterized protein n=1 Tax=Thermoclostridium stercorarium subsp. thermolacticum DSM 2910 TaxID=1121336 RepID=A0A1B1YBR6_THEST|nr:hypothetical protein [Thermoclostridium stercorarium]ANW98227.1 hypothetical protein CSTERTH_03825 [Thermoclostridium stercorarium subsp. thermolacticum DSM 2910]
MSNNTPKSKLEYTLFRIDNALYHITKDANIVEEKPTSVGMTSKRVFQPPLVLKPLIEKARKAIGELPPEQVAKLIEVVVKQQKAVEDSLHKSRREDDTDMVLTDEQFQSLRRDLLKALTNPQKVREEIEREEVAELIKGMQPPEWEALKQRKEQEAENERKQRTENRQKNMDALGITASLKRQQATASALTNAMLSSSMQKSERPIDIHDIAKLYATIDRLPYQKVREALMKRLNTALSQTSKGMEIWRSIKYKEITAPAEVTPINKIEETIEKIEKQYGGR